MGEDGLLVEVFLFLSFVFSVVCEGVGTGGGGGGRPPRGGKRDMMLGKTVKISAGPWKGCVGIVVDVTDTLARVELHTNCKTVSVDRTKVVEMADEKGELFHGSHNSYMSRPNPREEYGMTPQYTMSTPLHSSTPLRPDTPSWNDAWNPTRATTPLRPDTPSWNDDHNSSWTPNSSDYLTPRDNPNTSSSMPPVYSPYSTPQDQVYNPSTPTGFMASQLDTPNFTPGTAYNDQHTPGISEPSPQAFPPTPSTPGIPRTPGTPSVDSHYDESHYHGRDDDDGHHHQTWYHTGIQVKILSGPYASQRGTIREVNPTRDGSYMCAVELSDKRELVNIRGEQLEYVLPKKPGDRVRITRGELKGAMGAVFTVEGSDAIIKVDGQEDIKIQNINHLALIVP